MTELQVMHALIEHLTIDLINNFEERPPNKWLSLIVVDMVPLVMGLGIGYVKWYIPRWKNRRKKVKR